MAIHSRKGNRSPRSCNLWVGEGGDNSWSVIRSPCFWHRPLSYKGGAYIAACTWSRITPTLVYSSSSGRAERVKGCCSLSPYLSPREIKCFSKMHHRAPRGTESVRNGKGIKCCCQNCTAVVVKWRLWKIQMELLQDKFKLFCSLKIHTKSS